MELRPEDLITLYYNKVATQFPHLTQAQFSTICKHPYEYTAQRISTKDYDAIRLKNLGKFMVYETKIIKIMNVLKNSFNRQVITRDTYLYKIAQYQKILTSITANEGMIIIDDTDPQTPTLTIPNESTSNLTYLRPDNRQRQFPNSTTTP
jgi:hypothetical protein